jgi:hypothetical protein
MTETVPDGYERVFVVTYFYDWPRAGIANFRGTPHAFDCIFDKIEDEYSDVYRLKLIDVPTLRLALEQEEIWRRWQAAYLRGEVALELHQALPHERERYEQLAAILKPALEVPQDSALQAVGTFRSSNVHAEGWNSEVLWQPVA